ncbi:unnamed protein product [Periconia digitata]|uniref:Uncharacterized protein n=1 Tax=Periconia digitata TaxID=1303443 RepID=A0A9W4UGN3_9PLEO|nr:unnamed protein product [Periconia digitata]
MPIPTLSSPLKLRSRIKEASTRSERSQPQLDQARSGSADTQSTSLNATDEQKRRSFLPQRGIARSLFRKNASADTPITKSQNGDGPASARESLDDAVPSQTQQHHVNRSTAELGRSRPRSLYQPRAAQNPILERDETDSSRASDRVNKSLHSGGLQRSASSRQPVAPSQATQPANSRGHARTRSTATALSKGSTERPRSLVSMPGHGTKPTLSVDLDSSAAAPRTSARLEALKRSSSTRARPESVRDRPAAATKPAPRDVSQSQSGLHEVPKVDSSKLARPAFSTLQQHFTPRKTAKAATSTFFHPPPDVSAAHLPQEVILLQSELLQLHLLHASSAQTSRQWELSAQESLRGRFDEVASLYRVMREYERNEMEQKNIQALRELNGAASFSGLAKHLQALSGPLNEAPALLDSGGRYHDVLRQFQEWMRHVEEIWSLRNSSSSGGLSETGSIESLDDWWKEENQVLTRKLTSFLRDLDSLQPPTSESSIAYIVTVCKQLLEGMVAELKTMQSIHADVVAKEEMWVEDCLRKIAQDIGAILENNEEEEAWRF